MNGNVTVYVTTTFGNTQALQINGTTGLATVLANPTDNLGVVTKQYSDAMQSALNSSIVSNVLILNTTVNTLRTNVYADLSSNVSRSSSSSSSVVSTSFALPIPKPDK